jgi:hypothetical protein
MNSLPKLNKETIKEFEIGGFNLKFRKVKLSDADLFVNIAKFNLVGLAQSIYALAYLMTGYDESIEQRIEFLTNIELNGAEEMFRIKEMLEELGIEKSSEQDTTKNLKKKK